MRQDGSNQSANTGPTLQGVCTSKNTIQYYTNPHKRFRFIEHQWATKNAAYPCSLIHQWDQQHYETQRIVIIDLIWWNRPFPTFFVDFRSYNFFDYAQIPPNKVGTDLKGCDPLMFRQKLQRFATLFCGFFLPPGFHSAVNYHHSQILTRLFFIIISCEWFLVFTFYCDTHPGSRPSRKDSISRVSSQGHGRYQHYTRVQV